MIGSGQVELASHSRGRLIRWSQIDWNQSGEIDCIWSCRIDWNKSGRIDLKQL